MTKERDEIKSMGGAGAGMSEDGAAVADGAQSANGNPSADGIHSADAKAGAGKRRSFYIALCAVIAALTLVTSLFPAVFLLPIVVAAAFKDIRITLFSAAFFGVISYLYSFMGVSVVAYAFIKNPLIPIIPRIAVGIAAHYAFLLFEKLTKNKMIAAGAAGVCAALSNSVLVISALVVFAPALEFEGTTVVAYAGTMMVAGAIELAVSAVAAPPVVFALRKAKALK